MAANPVKPIRCAIYTRKSTEHGLELEFNSLDAQWDACEAFIKSQASQGWRVLPQHYDDPAFSGGNLDRPALQQLLKDIDAGRIDVVVVYKIDRLTRSLADFAKLVEAFDAKSISFVAVTQQFNTTTSMGRLTLNILLSFAQFERELSSERVRDKVAASRRKGKWTGGTVPLGYDAIDKKLVINPQEAETVRYIFKRYLDLKSFGWLVQDLDRRGIVTKRRETRVKKYQGGIPFTYGPLAHVLKNRIYIGEIGHGGKWFEGEHEAILDRTAFDQAQELLASNTCNRNVKRSLSGAFLMGKLYDDQGNRMSPSFSVKNGVRYRFYVSSALLRGRKSAAGSVARIPAHEIEAAIETALRNRIESADESPSTADLFKLIDKIVVKDDTVVVTVRAANDDQEAPPDTFTIPWLTNSKLSRTHIPTDHDANMADQKLLQSVVRARTWVNALADGEYGSIEDLAEAVKIHPKVIRQNLRLAFLAPSITQAIVEGQRTDGISLSMIPNKLPIRWSEQIHALGT